MKGKKKMKSIRLKFFAIAVAIVTVSGVTSIFAIPDETNAVHISDSNIENSTLIIGSHLIYLTSMNDSIYEIASESAEEYNQHNMYYKSEMAGGTWYEISDASALADITTEGVVVDKREIEELWLTHHTRADGITYSLKTGKIMSIFDIKNTYDLEGMSELEPIKIQYDLLQQLEDKSDTNKRDILYIEEVYNKNRETEWTKQIDQWLNDVQLYHEHLVRNNADSDMRAMVTNIMEKIDAVRRVMVLTSLNETELQKMNEVIGREFVYIQGEVTGDFVMSEERQKKAKEAAATERAKIQAEIAAETDEEKKAELEANAPARIEAAEKAAVEAVMNEKRESIEGFVLNTDLTNAIGEAMSNVQESYINYSAKMLEEGTTVLSKAEYRLIQEVIGHAKTRNYSQCDVFVKKLIYLERVNNNVIIEEVLEREFIAAELLEAAEKAYMDSLSAGECEAYKMLSSMASVATKANVLKSQMNETEIVRNEFQFILQAYMDRLSPEDASAYLMERMNQADTLRAGIKEDAYATYAESSLEQHLDWANTMLNNIQNAVGNSEMSSLMNQKEALQTELMTALDKNQLDKAKAIETEIQAVDKSIEDLEKKLNEIINSNQASDSEKALAKAQLSAGSSLKALQDMKDNALEEIREGNLNGIENIINGIGALADAQPEGALNALKDIYQELVNQELMNGGSSALNDLMGKVEDVTTEQMSNFLGNLSENDFADLIQNYMEEMGQDTYADNSGTSGNGLLNNSGSNAPDSLEEVFDNLSDQDAAMVLAGLSMYAKQTGSQTAEDILETYGKVSQNDGNPYVFQLYSDDVTYEYVPTDKLARIVGFRYIFNDSQKAVTLQKGVQYYKFTAFSNLMQKSMEELEMTRAAGYETVIYIPKDVAEEQFGLMMQSLEDTSYGVILTTNMKNQANGFVDYLLEAGGSI